jgi:hypothetical protein
LRLRLAKLVSTPQHEPDEKAATPAPRMEQTTHDLIARRVREKRQRKPG